MLYFIGKKDDLLLHLKSKWGGGGGGVDANTFSGMGSC